MFLNVFLRCFFLMGSIFVVMRNTVDGLTHNIHKETNGDRETIYNFHILHYVKKKYFE